MAHAALCLRVHPLAAEGARSPDGRAALWLLGIHSGRPRALPPFSSWQCASGVLGWPFHQRSHLREPPEGASSLFTWWGLGTKLGLPLPASANPLTELSPSARDPTGLQWVPRPPGGQGLLPAGESGCGDTAQGTLICLVTARPFLKPDKGKWSVEGQEGRGPQAAPDTLGRASPVPRKPRCPPQGALLPGALLPRAACVFGALWPLGPSPSFIPHGSSLKTTSSGQDVCFGSERPSAGPVPPPPSRDIKCHQGGRRQRRWV